MATLEKDHARVLTAPIARCDAFEISDAVVAELSHKREDGALRVRALGAPSAARHFDRAADDLPAASLHALHRDIDVADVEVVKPEGDRTADTCPSRRCTRGPST